MHKSHITLLFYYFLIFFIYLELINPTYIINPISGFPYSAGKIGFIIIGIISLNKRIIDHDKSVWFVFLFITGLLLGSFHSVNVSESIQKAFGQGLLYIAAIGFGRIFFKLNNKRLFDILFLLMFIQWCYYILSPLKTGQLNLDINFNSTLQEITLFNKHSIGLPLTTSSIYLFIRLSQAGIFANSRKIRLLLYSITITILIITTYLLFVIQSRSNFIFYFITLAIYFIYTYGKTNKKQIVLGGIVLFISYYYIYNTVFSSNEFLNQQFYIGYSEYHDQTFLSRFNLYSAFIFQLYENPLGIGGFEPYVEIGYRRALMHNQYMTYIVTTGIIGIVAVSILFLILFKTLLIKEVSGRNNKQITPKGYKIIYTPIKYMLILFFMTLLTVESGGLFFMFMLSLLFELHRKFYLSLKL